MSSSHVLGTEGATVMKGRVEPNSPGGFVGFFEGFPPGSLRAVFEFPMKSTPFNRLFGLALRIPNTLASGSGSGKRFLAF